MTLVPSQHGSTVGKSTYQKIGKVPASVQDIICRHCGAEFHCEVVLSKPSRFTLAELKEKMNQPR